MRGPSGQDLPHAVLYLCTRNAIRSPMAAALTRHYLGRSLYVESAGVRPSERDPFAVETMAEIGIDLGAHRPRSFEDLEDTSFDLIVTLSPDAHHKAIAMADRLALSVDYWPTLDPSAVEGSRDQILEAYRGVRNALDARIRARFLVGPPPSI